MPKMGPQTSGVPAPGRGLGVGCDLAVGFAVGLAVGFGVGFGVADGVAVGVGVVVALDVGATLAEAAASAPASLPGGRDATKRAPPTTIRTLRRTSSGPATAGDGRRAVPGPIGREPVAIRADGEPGPLTGGRIGGAIAGPGVAASPRAAAAAPGARA